MRLIEILLAQASSPTIAPPTTQGNPPPPLFQFLGNPLFLVAMMLLLLWVFSMGGKRKEERQRQDMLKQLKKGDRIQTIGGILGTVVEARDTEVLVKVDESSNTKVRFARSAIHRVLEEEKSESK